MSDKAGNVKVSALQCKKRIQCRIRKNKSDLNPMDSMLTVSSLVFLTNILSTWYRGKSVYCLLFCGLSLTSIFFHTYGCPYMCILDKGMIVGIVLYGGYTIYQKSSPHYAAAIVLTFLATLFLYYYGYCIKNYCYHPDKSVSDRYHALLHVISSIGHHLIIL